ncbi:MAG: universal stress protein [Bacteroidales bacterium]|nr:universal stress protein [Bacteroidales bacterium]
MNNIIVGFDFSTGSANAVDLTIDIANHWQTDIRLVYVKSAGEDEEPIRAEIERRNEGVAHLLKDIKLEYVIREGKVSEQLAAQANEDQALMVVVGTHGMSGFETNWIGKNTYRTITECPVPVLSVREDFDFHKNLESIIVPLDSTTETRQKVPFAARFAKTFGSTIHLLGLYTSESKDIRGLVNGYVEQVEKYLDKHEVKHVTEYVDASKNLTVTTLNYADQINADMIVIMTEQEKALTSWLIGNYAQQMLHLSKHPILSIRPEQIGSQSR